MPRITSFKSLRLMGQRGQTIRVHGVCHPEVGNFQEVLLENITCAWHVE